MSRPQRPEQCIMARYGLFRSLQFRLTALYVLIFGVLQAGLWLGLDQVRERHLHRNFDNGLISRAQSLIETLDSQSQREPDRPQHDLIRDVIAAYANSDLYVQIQIPSRNCCYRSTNLLGFTLPLEPSDAHPDSPALRSVAGDLADQLAGAGHEMRVLTMAIDSEALEPGFVQVASSLGPIQQNSLQIRRMLVLFVALSLVLAGLTSWLMVRRSLKPLEQLSGEARKITSSHLNERILLPDVHDEVAEAVQHVNAMLDRLQSEFENQQRFISDVSHELKTPLAVLIGKAEEYSRKVDDADGNGVFASVVLEESRQLLRIVDSFLTLSRARSQKIKTTRRPVLIEDLVLESIRKCKSKARQCGVRLVPHFDDHVGREEPVVMGDQDLLGSMIENLLRNAIRHGPPGSVVEVRLKCAETQISLLVRDHGPGIPEDEMDRIFDMFYQIKGDESHKPGSSGVGLSIVKTVAELHSGTVSVRNPQDGGCEFRVDLSPAVKPGFRGDASNRPGTDDGLNNTVDLY